MNFNDRFLIAERLDLVWAFVQDPVALLGCLPGSSGVAATEDGAISAVVADRVGPFQVEFHVTGTFTAHPDERRIEAEGGGRDVKLGNNLSLKVGLTLREVESGEVEVRVDAEFSIVGKVASLGFGIMKDKARKTMAGFVANVQQGLGSRMIS